MRKIIVLIVLGLFLLSSCSNQKPEDLIGGGTPIPSDSKPVDVSIGNDKEFKITAKQFSFEPSIIEVNKGDKVRLIVTSVDVPHGISIPEYKINEKLEPGKPVTIEFTADKQGTFTAYCSVFCGSGHSSMKGKLIVR